MECKKCGKEISSETVICPECGEPTKKAINMANSKNGRGKKFLLVVMALVLVSGLVFVGINTLRGHKNNQPYVEPQTTEYQKPKSEIADMADSIKGALEEEGYTDVSAVKYCLFQDFVNGAKNNPNDSLFLRTKWYSLSTMYDNTKFYTNRDAINFFNEHNMTDSTYLFAFVAEKKDKYGKQISGVVYVLVEYTDYDSKKWHYWKFPSFVGDEVNIGEMVIGAISEKCESHDIE